MYLSILAEHELLHLLGDYTEVFLGVVAIVGVVLGLSRWIVKKVETASSDDAQLTQVIKGQKELVQGITKTNKDLKTHMEEENEVRAEEYKLIQESIDTNTTDHAKIFKKIDTIMETQGVSVQRQVENTLSM